MYPIALGNTFMAQQSVSGTGVFNGSEYGRAKGHVANADPNAVVRISARLYGVAPNSYLIQFVDAGAGIEVPATTVQQTGALIQVTLRRSISLGLLATAAEVADAINRTTTGIVATYGGTGNGLVAAMAAQAITNDALGVDALISGPGSEVVRYQLPANVSGGFFYFEQTQTIAIRQFEAKFVLASGTYTVTVERVNLNANLEPVSGEAIPNYVWEGITAARPDIAYSDNNLYLHPYQALRVLTSGPGLSGVVRFDARKVSGYPYGS